jgi:hypothetical protein
MANDRIKRLAPQFMQNNQQFFNHNRHKKAAPEQESSRKPKASSVFGCIVPSAADRS